MKHLHWINKYQPFGRRLVYAQWVDNVSKLSMFFALVTQEAIKRHHLKKQINPTELFKFLNITDLITQ